MSDPTCPAPEGQSFGDALAELDSIVAALENGQLDLEESLTNYESGVALLKTLQAKLADAQQKVTMLMGELGEEPEEAASTTSAPEASGTSTRSEEVDF
jgi:exodeoxyribonuclease VII small subunit